MGNREVFADYEGKLEPLGPALLIPTAHRNLVSLGVITKHLQVSFSSGPLVGSVAKSRLLHDEIFSGKFITFVQDERDRYPFRSPHIWTHANLSGQKTADDRRNQEVLVEVTVYNFETPVQFTNAELDRARRAGVLHHPCNAYLSTILDNGTMANIAGKDLRSYLIGKSRQSSSQKVSSVTYPPGHLLMMDIFFPTEPQEGRSHISFQCSLRQGTSSMHVFPRRLPMSSRPPSRTSSISTSPRVIQVVYFFNSKLINDPKLIPDLKALLT